MSNKEKEAICFIILIVLILLGVGGASWTCGNETAITGTRQTLCREFMKETTDYINCNTKALDEIIKMIKEQTNEK